MQKLLRSLLAVGALATLAACGDDVSIVEPDNVVISGAPTTAIKVGDVVQLSANVAVSWSSAAPAVATVDAGSGLVTAVGAGIVSITATSQNDASKKASVTITVTGNISPTVSIFAVTAGGTNLPVNPNNVVGQIDVVVNMDPGDFTVASLDLLVDGQVAQTQTFAQALVEPKPVDEEMAAQVQQVSFSLNTGEFDPNTGAVKWTNGTHTISARVTVTGGGSGGAAEPSRTLTFNNASGFVAKVTNTNTVGGPASAINTTSGLKWIQGDVKLELAAVNYVAGGATVTNVNGSFLGRAFSATPAAGTQIFTVNFLNSGTASTNIVGYQTVADADKIPSVTASVLSSGSQGPTNILNVGAQAAVNGLTPLDSTRVDNVAPAAPTVGAFPTWLNNKFTFTNSNANVSGLTDAGVGGVTTEFWVIKGALPTPSCSTTGMTKVSDAAGLDTTNTTQYNGKVVVLDALFNKICAALGTAPGTSFGVDTIPPANVTIAGVADGDAFNSIATAMGTNYVLSSTGDNASGISGTTPGLVSITVDSTGSAKCVIGTGSSCAQNAQPGTGSITGGLNGQGYFTLTAQMTDNAGNAAPSPAFSRLFLVDQTAPTFTGNVGLAAQYQGNAQAQFTNIQASDNLDLNRLFAGVQYASVGIIEYPSQSLGAFGTPLETSFNGTYTIASLIRCINGANSFAANAASEALQIGFFAEDHAGNQNILFPVAGALQAALDNCGAVGNLTAPAAINTFGADTADYGGATKTQVSKGGTTTGANSATVGLRAIADVTLDNAPEPFTRVEFYYQDVNTGRWIFIGQSGPGQLNQTVTTRTWTYRFTWDPDDSVPSAGTPVIAIGIDADGDAVHTPGVVVNVAN